MTNEPKRKTSFFVHVALPTPGNLILGMVDRKRVVKVDKTWDSVVYDIPPLLIGTKMGNIIRQVDPRRGEVVELGPFQELYAMSMTGSSINVHLTVEDLTYDGAGTDLGGKPEVAQFGGGGGAAEPVAIPAPGSVRTFRAIRC
jgi:hypothetical protein